MNEGLVKIIENGLEGKFTHINPKKAINGLSPENARKKFNDSTHSCWDLLHHIVVWQEGILDAIEGNEVDWEDIEKNNNWPTDDYLSKDSNLEPLIEKFMQGLEKAKKLANSIDLNLPMPAWRNAPVMQGFMVLLQHNSYHLGQLITTRKNLDIWESQK